MRICSLGKPESHLAEELKGGGNIFCGIFFSPGGEELQGSVRPILNNGFEIERIEGNV
jgi:hypothetical protein